MRLDEITKPDYKIYCDIDGVLSDFIGGVKKIFPEYTEEKYESDNKFRSKMWKAVRKYAKEGGKLWGELEVMSDAPALWTYIKKYNPQILSATGETDTGADKQKRDWIAEHFGKPVKVNLVKRAEEKSKHAKKGRILIDDKEKALKPWRAAGGIGILHTSAASTIKELKKLGL